MSSAELVSEILAHGGVATCPGDDELAVLWALAACRDAGGQPEVTAPTVATVVREVGRRSMTRQAASGTLSRLAKGPAVHRRKRRRHADLYSVMDAGCQRLDAQNSVKLVDPAKALDEMRTLEDVLSSLTGRVAICDPYLDSRSLDFVACMISATSTRYLTERVTDRDKVMREIGAASQQSGAAIEVRRARNGILHDRYIIHDGGMIVLGTSLNSFGLRQSFVSRVGHDVRRATLGFFDDTWSSASPL